MKHYTDEHVDTQGQFPRIDVEPYRENLVKCLLPWQRAGRQETASGYGAKLTSSFKISFNGKLYRIYHTCYGNASTAWFTAKGRKIIVW